MTVLSRRRAHLYSLLVHVAALAGLLTVDVQVARARSRAQRLAEAHAHAPVLQRNAAEAGAERLRKIRELAERLDREQQSGPRTIAAPKAGPPTANQANPSTAGHSASVPELYEQSKRDYAAARGRLLDAEAKHLARISGQPLASARAAVESQYPDSKGGAGANGGAVSQPEEIGRMGAEAQRMLGRVLELQRTDREGTFIAPEDARDAYAMANESQQLSEEARGFAPVVDWTRLMNRPLSTVPVNGILDHDAAEFRRVETQLERTLRTRFLSRREPLRFGRRIGPSGSEHGEWISPDAWYIIGPFDNPHRAAIDRSFPPDVEIDRDATYTGKDGQPIAWEYVRVRQIGVIPPHPEEYAIYYAYTEIYASQPMDCWLALGSDDHSKLWVNGLLVWSDTRNQKNWSPTEGFRHVHLNGGFNRFLLRLENGWNGTMFSVALLLE